MPTFQKHGGQLICRSISFPAFSGSPRILLKLCTSWGNKQNAAAKIDESVKIGIWGYFCMRKKKKYGALRET